MSLSVPNPTDQAFTFPSQVSAFPSGFSLSWCVFPAPVEAHSVPLSVTCVFTDSTEHICFAELLSPLNQDELSGVAVALQSSR